MEDWQLEARLYAAGMCSENVEDMLIKIEEALEKGEIDLSDAIQIHSDYTDIKEKRMKPENLLHSLLRDSKTEAEKKLLYKACINAFTSAVATNILIDIANRQRMEIAGMNDTSMMSDLPTTRVEPGSVPSHHGEPTLDERNAADFALDGEDFSKQLTEAAGHETPQRAILVAEICDGIRNDLYDEMFAFTDLAPKTALYRHIAETPDGRPNFNQPMGLDFNLRFRINRAGVVNDARAKQVAKEDDVDVEFIREIMRKDNERQAERLKQLMPEVVRTAESFESHYGIDDFVNLPIDQQIKIATKIAGTINNEYQRLYGIKIRTGNLDVAQQCTIMKANWQEVQAWIDNTTKLMNLQSQNAR